MTAALRSIVACSGALAVAAPVRADDAFSDDSFPSWFLEEPSVPNPYRYAWSDPRMASRIGIGVTVSGSVTGFTDAAMRDVIQDNVGVGWNVRASLGTHIPLGVELNYFGSVSQLQTFADTYNGMLIGTAFEAVLRYTILPLASGTPYLFAGGGWQIYDVRDSTLTSLADNGMRDSDRVAEFPMGAGAAYRDPSGWVGDVRGTFRLTTDSVLLTEANGENAKLYTWEASAAIGYEF
jgi:hypothetical protein